MHAVHLQEPRCRRQAILSYFGEKAPRCQQPSEQPCDFCQNSRQAYKDIDMVKEALQAKAAAAAAPQKLAETMHLPAYHAAADCVSSNCANTPASDKSPCTTLEASASKPKAAGAKRLASIKPLLRPHKHKMQAVPTKASLGDDSRKGSQGQFDSQPSACSSNTAAASGPLQSSNISNDVLKSRFKPPRRIGQT